MRELHVGLAEQRDRPAATGQRLGDTLVIHFIPPSLAGFVFGLETCLSDRIASQIIYFFL
jgi:hypothetical protein